MNPCCVVTLGKVPPCWIRLMKQEKKKILKSNSVRFLNPLDVLVRRVHVVLTRSLQFFAAAFIISGASAAMEDLLLTEKSVKLFLHSTVHRCFAVKIVLLNRLNLPWFGRHQQ